MTSMVPEHMSDTPGGPPHIEAASTSAQLCAKLGITYRQLDYWCRSGLLEGMPNGTGHGISRLFSARQARIVGAASQLIHAGFTPRSAARMVNVLELSGETTATVWTDHVRVEVTLPQPIKANP